MKKVGIIGGIGPASTLDYYKGIIEGYMAKTLDENYPEIIINSINMTEMMSYAQNDDWDCIINQLTLAIRSLRNAGAQFAAIASNTPHIVFDAIQKKSEIPIISIVEETCKFILKMNCQRVVAIGTLNTMKSGLYINALKKHGIDAISPTEAEQAKIYSLFFPNLENGIVIPKDKEKMIKLINKILKKQNADALILGCTELPLMIQEGDIDTMIINTTKIHIDSIIDYLS